jgi:type II secretory pathway pseudopilin PulG
MKTLYFKSKSRKSKNQRGYILLSVMLLMTLMLIAMTIEAPRIAQRIKREKEEELIHRGDQYRIAIKKFYRKNGTYPISLDQLQNTNNVRYLRKRYTDPFTGKDDWHLLHVGEVQLNPLTGGASAAGAQGSGQPTGNTSPFSSTLNPSSASGSTGSTVGATAGPTGTAGTTGTSQPDPNGSGSTIGTSASSISSSLGGGNQQFGGGPIIGVSSTSKKKSIKEINGKDHYNDWQFVYDPRLEAQQQLGAGGGIQGASPIGTQTGPSGFNNGSSGGFNNGGSGGFNNGGTGGSTTPTTGPGPGGTTPPPGGTTTPP